MRLKLASLAKRFLLGSAALSLLLPAILTPAFACFSPADPYAVEVLLNKPGVSYDLSKLSQQSEVVQTPSGAYVYRSRYDERLIVALSEQGLELVGAGQSSEGPVTTVGIAGESVNAGELEERVREVVNDGLSGWEVDKYIFPDGIEGFAFTKVVGNSAVRVYVGAGSGEIRVGLSIACTACEGEMSEELASLIKSEVDSLLAELELSELSDLMDPFMVRSSLIRGPSRGSESERYLAVRIQVPIVQRVETATVFECGLTHGGVNSSELNPEATEELGWSVTAGGDEGALRFMLRKELSGAILLMSGVVEEGGVLRMFLRVEGASELKEDHFREFRLALDAMGLSEVSIDEGSFERLEESIGADVVPAFNASESEIKEALRVELEWLSSLGVITGLSEDDISEISARAELGNSGWNERLVWWEGRWVPYSETGMPLVRCFGPLPEFLSSEALDALGMGELGLGSEQAHESNVEGPLPLCGTSELPPRDRIDTLQGTLFAIAIITAGSLAIALILSLIHI